MSVRFITFHYTLRDRAGRVLDTSQGGDPTPFVEGTGQIIEGLEEALLSLAPGEQRRIVVSAEKGYGLPDAELIQKVPRSSLPVAELKAGDQFQTGPDRHAPVVTVVAIEGNEVLLDANHPLAGQELQFDVEVVASRPATADEQEQARDKIVD